MRSRSRQASTSAPRDLTEPSRFPRGRLCDSWSVGPEVEPTPMPRRKPPQRRAYDTDLTDGQWERIAPLIPEAWPGGRPRKAASRELVNAILYFLRAGMAWRLLPPDLPPWQTVSYYSRRWDREGVWRRIHHTLVMAARERAGREPSPSGAVPDSPTVPIGRASCRDRECQ